MADLTWLEKRRIEEFFSSARSPTNWFATHDDLNEIFSKYKLDQYDLEKPGPSGFSKREKIRAMWNACPNSVVASILLELLEIGLGMQEIHPYEWISDYNECKGILESLKFRDEGAPETKLSKHYFQNQKESLLKDWDAANLGIWISQYLFTDRQLADKLLFKYREGITVMMILQEDEKNRQLQKTHWDKMPCSVWWFPKTDRSGINHHKFCIIDGQILWHGSFNFTWSASNLNQEEFTRNANIENVREFSAEFTRLRRIIDDKADIII